jgi:hypothetical protein
MTGPLMRARRGAAHCSEHVLTGEAFYHFVALNPSLLKAIKLREKIAAVARTGNIQGNK